MLKDAGQASAARSHRTWYICLAIAAAVLLVYTAVNAAVRPVIWSDSGWGLLWWYARDSLPFNYTYVPSHDDLAKDVPMFMAEWSPGQHLLPAAVEALGVDLGLSVIIVVALSSALGLWGWYGLYRAFGFAPEPSAVAVTLVALSRHFSMPFGIYVGGEVLIFAAAPWFLLLVWNLRNLSATAILPVLAGTAVMFFAKLSGMMVACAAIGAAALCSGDSWFTRRTLLRAVVSGVTIAIVAVVFYVTWYSRGWTAVVSAGSFRWTDFASAVVFTIGCNWSAALSLGDLGNLILLHPGRQILTSPVPIACAFAPLAIATGFVLWRRLRSSYAEYLRFVFCTAAAYGAVMILIWSTGAAVGLEERYFRTTSMLFLVGVVQCFFELRRGIARSAMLAIAALTSAYGLASNAMHVRTNLQYPLSARGFRHSAANQPVIDFIHALDADTPYPRSTLIYVPSPEIGLDVRRVRVMAIHADYIPAEALAKIVYHGHVPRLYVIVPDKLLADGKAELLLRSFVDYPRGRWRSKALDGFTCFYATD